MVQGRVHLNHGDRLCIGGNHYFKISNPHNNINGSNSLLQPIDFDFAYQEILRIQEEKYVLKIIFYQNNNDKIKKLI